MIDYFALALVHGLLVVALLRLAGRDAVDADPAFADEGRRRAQDTTEPPGDG